MISRLFVITSKLSLSSALRSFSSDLPLVDGLKPVLMASDVYESENPDGSSASPVVVMHGLFGSKANWMTIARSIANQCKPQRKIIVTDLRNHGESPHADDHSYEHMSADLNHLMNVNQIKKVCVMGHSMGGRAAMYYTLTHPSLVEKAIILDVSPVNHKSESEFSFVRFFLDKMMEVKFPTGVSKFEARANIDKQLAVDIKKKAIRQFLLTNLVEKAPGFFGWRVNLSVISDNFYANIRTFPNVKGKIYEGPTLFIVGGNSNSCGNPKDHRFIKELFPNTNIITIPNVGHWLHVENAKEVINQCVYFLNKQQ
ncbi:hypothetical protein FQR65_LT06936 [Abscondita terminalis]|nr:hypothetical protein FQR65_LT06936 [Abscondita terminalis]